MAKPKHTYAHLVGKLPRLDVAPERRDVIIAVKDRIKKAVPRSPKEGTTEDFTEVGVSGIRGAVEAIIASAAGHPSAIRYAKLYAAARQLADVVETLDKEVGLLVEAAQWVMADQMEAEGASGLRLDDGQPITTYPEPYAQVEDREKFRLWCIEQGLERQMALPWNTTNALVKRMLKEGEEEPPGVKAFMVTKVRLGGN